MATASAPLATLADNTCLSRLNGVFHRCAFPATHVKKTNLTRLLDPLCVRGVLQAGSRGSGRGVPELTVEAMIWNDSCNGQHKPGL